MSNQIMCSDILDTVEGWVTSDQEWDYVAFVCEASDAGKTARLMLRQACPSGLAWAAHHVGVPDTHIYMQQVAAFIEARDAWGNCEDDSPELEDRYNATNDWLSSRDGALARMEIIDIIHAAFVTLLEKK